MEPTIRVRVTCQQAFAVQVAEGLAGTFESFGETPTIIVTAPVQKGRCFIEIETGKPFTDGADDIFSEPGYDAICELPGVLEAEIISSDVERSIQ